MKAKKLDQFYTNPVVAQECFQVLKNTIDLSKYDYFLEPSAGAGYFLELFPPTKRIGLDLDPNHSEVVQQDFFEYVAPKGKKIITIGNPPFGKRSRLAVAFFNHAQVFSDVIAFIVPLQWQKWSVQSQIPKEFKLVIDNVLPKNSFLFDGEPYDVRCCFQVWTRDETYKNLKDLRMKEKPKISHPDFEMFLYNNTKQAEKFFYKDWDFAVPRQGYQDYSIRHTDESQCSRRIQWIFFKAKNKKIKDRLLSIDYDKLSKKNTSTPGWGKADLVEVYEQMFPN